MKENRLTVARANEILIKTLLKRVVGTIRDELLEKEIAGGKPMIVRPRNRPTYLPTTNYQVHLTN